MKRELQESCTHTVGAGRKEAVPGRGVNMLLAATQVLESEMGEGDQMVHLGCVLMKICNPFPFHCIWSLQYLPSGPSSDFASSQVGKTLTVPVSYCIMMLF